MSIDVACSLYIDQPVGVGFSYGSDNITTSQQAAVDVYKVLNVVVKYRPVADITCPVLANFLRGFSVLEVPAS